MKNKKLVMAAMMAGAVLVFAGCQKEEAPQKEATEKTEAAKDTGGEENEKAQSEPEESNQKVFGTFETKDLEGSSVTDEIFAQADLNLVNIWGTFCNPCLKEMPELGQLAAEYEGKGLQILGVVADAGDDTQKSQVDLAKEIVNETKASYTHLLASSDLTNNVLMTVSVVPTTYFVDKDGNMVGEPIFGALSKEDWIKEIEDRMQAV